MGSIKNTQSPLAEVAKNIPLGEGRFSEVEDEQVVMRCNFRRCAWFQSRSNYLPFIDKFDTLRQENQNWDFCLQKNKTH